MIFRWSWRRRFVGLFGPFVTPEAIDQVVADSTELHCFKLLLPRRIRSLVWTKRQALLEVRRAALEALASAKLSQDPDNPQN